MSGAGQHAPLRIGMIGVRIHGRRPCQAWRQLGVTDPRRLNHPADPGLAPGPTHAGRPHDELPTWQFCVQPGDVSPECGHYVGNVSGISHRWFPAAAIPTAVWVRPPIVLATLLAICR